MCQRLAQNERGRQLPHGVAGRLARINEDWLPPTEVGKPNASCVVHPSKVSQYRCSSATVTRGSDSREVDLFCRVYTRDSSDSSVHHLDFNLQPLGLVPAVFLSRAFREVPKHSPPELDPSSEPNKRPGPKRSTVARERQQPIGLLSYGFHSPPAYSVEVSTPHGLTSAATFRPRRFARPRRFTPPLPTPKSPPKTTHGVLALQGSSRTGRPNSSLSKTTLMVLVSAYPLSAGDESLDTNSPPGSCDLVRPSPPASGFPIRRGSHPLGYYFLGPPAQPPGFPLGATLVVPLHSPNCERATAFK